MTAGRSTPSDARTPAPAADPAQVAAAAAPPAPPAVVPSEGLPHRDLHGPSRAVVVALTLAGILLAVNQLFNLQLFVGVVLLDNTYLYLLAACFLPVVFLAFPAYRRAAPDRMPWYDVALAAAAIAVAGYFAWHGEQIVMEGWEYAAPDTVVWLSFVLWLLVLEGGRRAGGSVIFAVILLFSLYPTFADKVPGPISGFPAPLTDTVVFHMVSRESAFGIPMRAFGALVIGFIVFGATLQRTGAGTFFNNLALGTVGWLRGGAAKVAIFASGLMSSMSGSVVSNVLTTGVVSIPAMKRTGFSARYAAGVEACASTGGVLMPPVMGTTAFVMASFLGRPYVEIALAAAIPSLLYYFGLLVQIDAYAARRGLRGLERRELPGIGRTLKEGWFYILVFAVLVVFMLVLRQETLAPFWATAVLLVLNQLVPRTRLDLKGMVELLAGVGRSLAELVGVLLGVGLIVGAFSVTGLAGTLANDLIFLAGDATFVLLIMGAVTSFIFGLGMTVTACYIFLAIVLAPALTRAGLDPLAVHLFIMYWGMVSFITPPVALGAFAAATIAQTGPIRAGLEAMRLGSILYFIPFFFVLNPALIGQGEPVEVVVVVATAVVGILFIGAALQGYVTGIGAFGPGALAYAARAVLFAAGLFFASPGNVGLGLNHLEMALIGLAVALPALAYAYAANRRRGTPADLAAEREVTERP